MTLDLAFIYKLVIGDWSRDGHEKMRFVHFKSTHPIEDIRAAYLKTAKTAGVGLHYEAGLETILAEYEERDFSLDQKAQLEAAGVDFNRVGGSEYMVDRWGDLTEEAVARLFLEMAVAGCPTFEYEIVKDPIQCINGFHDKAFNHVIGYGVSG